MKKNILSQKYYQDDTSQKLIKLIEENIPELDDATLYYEFPLIRHLDGTVITSSIMIISKIYGVLLFKCDDIIKQRTFDEIEFLDNELSNIESVIFSKLIKSTNKKLKLNKRNLSFNLNSALYLPKYSESFADAENRIIKTTNDLKAFFKDSKNEQIEEDVLNEIFAIIDASTAIVKPKERRVAAEDTSSKAYILKQLEAETARFDDKQKYAALSQLEGPQRIRGLAGSGKTIILCMKAAILHYRNPDARILYTFKTKSYDLGSNPKLKRDGKKSLNFR